MQNKTKFKQTTITEKDKQLFNELNSFLFPFNDFQKKAIISESPIILCIAGAGSGKTTVLTKRIEFLLKYKSVNPEKILAITFTRKAKQEMQGRLLKQGILVHIETFNSFCEKILRKNQFLIYGKDVRVIDQTSKVIAFIFSLQALNIKKDFIIEEYFTDSQIKNKSKEQLLSILINDCFSIIDFFKSKNEKLYDFSENSQNKKIAKLIFIICKQFQNYLKLHGFRTYNDQIIDTLSFFKKNSSLIPNFEHILVDEYQDVNDSQKELLDLLSPENLFVVGDPRQSIFGWRGSNIDLILNFETNYSNCETIILNKNYRSTRNIVNFMNKFIEDLKLPELESSFQEENILLLKNFFSEEEELSFIVEEAFKIVRNDKNIFILTRTNSQLEKLSDLMKQKKIYHFIKTEENLSPEKGIILSTIHSIKGLEADAVFIIGCNEQNFPCKYSENPVIDILKINDYDKEQEEKRLFYVAISRAKKNLFLTYSGKNHTPFINEKMKSLLSVET